MIHPAILGVIAGNRRRTLISDPLRAYVLTLALAEAANGSTTFDDDVPANSNLNVYGSVAHSTSVTPPFGASSALFPGTTGNSSLGPVVAADWIGSGAGDSTFYLTPFCIDAFIYPTNLAAGVQCIGGDDIESGSVFWNGYWVITAAGAIGFNVRGGGGAGGPNGSIVQDAWQHVAVTGDGAGNHVCYVNGASVGTGTSTNYAKQGSGSWVWGEQNKNFGGFQRNFIGRQKCMRITWGHQRYTGAFTPPASLAAYS